MGDDVGLLSYLPHEKVRAAPFDNKAESGGHPLPVRIFFGKLEQDKTPPKNAWALLHSKPGSSRPPECRLKIFSRTGQLEEPNTLEEAMEKASPMPAFTCLKPRHGRFDRGHLSSVLRYYFILQKLKLPTQCPISDMFVAELKAACKVAKTNAEESLLVQKSQIAIGTAAAQSSGHRRGYKLQLSHKYAPILHILKHFRLTNRQDADVYTVSHKAIKGPHLSQATLVPNSHANRHAMSKTPAVNAKTHVAGHGDKKPSLAELLFGEGAEASLSGSTLAGTQSPTSSVEETPPISPKEFITSYRLNVTANEARERRLVENRESQTFLRAQLEELEEEEKMSKNALKQSKAERKRLRTSVSARDLVFLQLGQDLAHTDSKRLRLDDSSDE